MLPETAGVSGAHFVYSELPYEDMESIALSSQSEVSTQ